VALSYQYNAAYWIEVETSNPQASFGTCRLGHCISLRNHEISPSSGCDSPPPEYWGKCPIPRPSQPSPQCGTMHTSSNPAARRRQADT
jgi:hypothetical protein